MTSTERQELLRRIYDKCTLRYKAIKADAEKQNAHIDASRKSGDFVAIGIHARKVTELLGQAGAWLDARQIILEEMGR